jgi:hypothetical protein
MNARQQPSARRAGAPPRHAPVDYTAVWCSSCGRAGYAVRCSVCAKIVCTDRGSCHPKHSPREAGSINAPPARGEWAVAAPTRRS